MTHSETKGYYDDFSGWYERERHHGYHAMLDDLQLEILRPLAENRDVIEVGCGTGLLMQGLSDTARRLAGERSTPSRARERMKRVRRSCAFPLVAK